MKVRFAEGTRDMRAVWFEDGMLKLIDQRRLPQALETVETADWRRATEMIRDMTVRGAPAIGITAAYAMALALRAGEDAALFLKQGFAALRTLLARRLIPRAEIALRPAFAAVEHESAA